MSELPPQPPEAEERPMQEPVPAGSQTVAAQSAPASRKSIAARCFDLLAAVGPLTLLVFAALQTVPGLRERSLFLPEELHLAAVHQTLVQSGNWAVLQFDGAPYTALPPAFFWFAEALGDLRLPLSADALLLAAATAGLLLFVLAIWLLAKAAGNVNRTALAAGVIALTAFSTIAMAHLALPDFLFAACVTFSSVCLYRGWIKNSAPLLMLCGFALAALAALVQGPLGLGLPLLGSLFFLIWRGSFHRAGARDGALGFGLMLVLLLSWVAYLAFDPDGKPYLNAWLQERILAPARSALHPPSEWWKPAQALAWLWMPWTLLVPFLPWERLFAVPVAIWKNRTRDPGAGWLWCSLLSGLALYCVFPPDRPAALLALFPPLAVLTARAVTGLAPTRSRLFFGLLGLLMLAGATLCVLLALGEQFPALRDWLPAVLPDPVAARVLPTLEQIRGLPWLAGICILFALFSLATDKKYPAGGLLLWLLFCTALVQPLNLISLPALAPAPALEQAAPHSTTPESAPPGTTPAAPVEPDTEPDLPLASPQAAHPEQPAAQDVPKAPALPPADARPPADPLPSAPPDGALSSVPESGSAPEQTETSL